MPSTHRHHRVKIMSRLRTLDAPGAGAKSLFLTVCYRHLSFVYSQLMREPNPSREPPNAG